MTVLNKGDIVEWRGANHLIRGEVVVAEDRLMIVSDKGKTFRLHDLLGSKSLEVIIDKHQ